MLLCGRYRWQRLQLLSHLERGHVSYRLDAIAGQINCNCEYLLKCANFLSWSFSRHEFTLFCAVLITTNKKFVWRGRHISKVTDLQITEIQWCNVSSVWSCIYQSFTPCLILVSVKVWMVTNIMRVMSYVVLCTFTPVAACTPQLKLM